MSYNPGTLFRIPLSPTIHITAVLLTNGQLLQVKPKHDTTFSSLDDWRKFHDINDNIKISIDTSKSSGKCFTVVNNINYPSWSKDNAYNIAKWVYRMVFEFANDLLSNTEFVKAYNDFVDVCKKYEKKLISYGSSSYELYNTKRFIKHTNMFGYIGYFRNVDFTYKKSAESQVKDSFIKVVSFIPDSMITIMNEKYEVDKKRKILSNYNRKKKNTEKKITQLNEIIKICDDNIHRLSIEISNYPSA
jgi:hypothetical protein